MLSISSAAPDNASEGDPSTPKETDPKSVDATPVSSPAKPSTGQAAAATLAEAGHTLEGSEADLVILPLRLAFETKQSKIVESALDCLHVSSIDLIESTKKQCQSFPNYQWQLSILWKNWKWRTVYLVMHFL